MDLFNIWLILQVFATIQTTQTTTVCEDLDADCAEYGHDYICNGDYIPWSTIHCRKFCGLCPVVNCVDLDSDCAEYGYNYICQGDYIPWSKIHCQKYCGFCTGVPSKAPETTTVPTTTTTTVKVVATTTVATVSTVCVDLDPDCAEYGNDYICTGDYIPWSTIHCNKTCNFCHDTCVDLDSDCADYGTDYICRGDYIPWSNIHCAKYCNLCQATTLPATTIQISTTPSTTTTTSTTTKTTTPTTTKPTTTTPTTTKPPTTTPTTTMPTTTTPTTTTPTTTRPTTTKRTTTTSKTTTQILTTTVSPEEACGNVLSDCDKYRLELCTDLDQREWMWDNCRGYCKLCLKNRPCKDTTIGCADFKDMICSDPALSLECKDTCGIC